MRIHDATYGRLQINYTTQPRAIWRVICARDPETRERGSLSVVLMKMNTTIGDYVQIKSKRLQGCTTSYRGFVFNKKSILIGYVPGLHTEGGELELGYVCISKSNTVECWYININIVKVKYMLNRNHFEIPRPYNTIKASHC